ncbi:hypothetical protein [Sphingomonas sp. Leaf257]|uniref:hypothetical protein n=1 Tax=Sphingomonas sp. Leaf257 TaxID=1736309 RepID=UPI0006FFE805|nr:hypothetical protein [Sphingomonas sp. Leaf257]KQO50615.1 hypothetical protein ASF14_11055 [Sphingomonas sp. Leaf257]
MADQIPDSTKSVRIALEDVTPVIAAAFADDPCLIWSGEHRAYWVAGGNGYTTGAAYAGRWTIADAYQQTKHCDPTKQISFERVDATRAAPPAMDREAVEVTADRLGKIMQEAWGEICDDAGAHPSDVAHGRGTVLHYRPSHWTSLIALRLTERLSTLSADAIRQGEGVRPSDDALLPFLPDTIEAGRRLGVERSEWLTGWFTSWSPRNDNSNAEGNWSEWVKLAHAIIGYNREAIAALTATPASHASDGGKA